MKKLSILLVLITFSLVSFTNAQDLTDYVVANGKAYYAKDVKFGLTKSSYIIAKMQDGTKKAFIKDEIDMYRIDGVTYEKKPLIKNNKVTDEFAFMEVIAYKNGMKIYKNSYFDINGKEVKDLYIFKKDHYVVDINNHNQEHLVQFFK